MINLNDIFLNQTNNCIMKVDNVIQLNGECISRKYCSQFNNYLTNMGISVIVMFIVFSWIKYLLYKHLNHKLDNDVYVPLGIFEIYLPLDYTKQSNKIWLEATISYMIDLILVGYIVVVVWLNLKF